MGSLRLQAERTGGSGTWQLGIHVSFSLALLVFRCERSKLPRGVGGTCGSSAQRFGVRTTLPFGTQEFQRT